MMSTQKMPQILILIPFKPEPDIHMFYHSFFPSTVQQCTFQKLRFFFILFGFWPNLGATLKNLKNIIIFKVQLKYVLCKVFFFVCVFYIFRYILNTYNFSEFWPKIDTPLVFGQIGLAPSTLGQI